MSFRGDRGRGRGPSPGRGSPDSFRGRGSPDSRGRGGRGGPDVRGRGAPEPRGRGFGGPGGRGSGFGSREQGGVFAANRPANIDVRLTNTTQDDIVRALKSLTTKPNDLPPRPGFGTSGRAIKLRANFFPISPPKGPWYEYDVSITPVAGTANRRVKRRIYQLAEATPDWTQQGLKGYVAHDHSAKLIAARKLVQPLQIRVPYFDEDEQGPKPGGKEYVLTIKFIQELEMDSLRNYLIGQLQYKDYPIAPVIAALNLILGAHPSWTGVGGGVMVGRNRYFFPSGAPPVSLSGGLEAWKGFYSSVRPAHHQLMVNVNVCTTAFYTPGNLAEAMNAFERASFGANVKAFVRTVRVKTTHLGYQKTVKILCDVNARQHSFECAELGGTVTVEQYFQRKYKIKLRYPELRLVDVGGQKSNLLPPEVCDILPNQPYRGKLTDEHTAQMITVACKPPNVNGEAIIGQGLNLLGFRQPASPLGSFGISIGSEMAVVPGRILNPPHIEYGQGKPDVDERASWNLRNVRFTRGGRLDNWAVLLIQDGNRRDEFTGTDDPQLGQTVYGFAEMCRKSGMNVSTNKPTYVAARLPQRRASDPTRQDAIAEIRKAIMSIKTKPTFLLVILSSGDKHIYSGLKHLCDSYLDLATVCVQSAKFRKERGQLQYFANVALKVNMKMGGINHALDRQSMQWLKSTPTMLVGIDVTHPGPGSVKGTPSIAAVVASVDEFFSQYPASMEIQESRKEIVTNLTNMMVERLKTFHSRNNVLPKRVLVYRDGVSEGQFSIVVADELPSIKAAFRKFDTAQGPYTPKLTIVICGKRHHTRFYPTEASTADRDGNPRPGTVVDRGVTAVYEFDFFLQAHGGLQGTTRPTHYYVVHDEIQFSADILQTLTNSVSYMFARATKAVSLVSPAYYADLACERGRCYLHRLLQGFSSSGVTSASGNEEQVMKEAQQMWHGGVSGNLKNTMFYL